MKAIYFDCFAGISGNMILGALLDAGLELSVLKKELGKLALHGYELKVTKVQKHGITGTYVEVLTDEHAERHKGHHGHHPHRHLDDITALIRASTLDDMVKETACRIFTRLAEAEAKVHNTTPTHIHFHEVGAVDAIVDIVGAAIGLHKLGLEKVFASPLHLGSGFTHCAHGCIPLPAPATLELLAGVPVYDTGIKKELVTPTGAAIITTVAARFGAIPAMRVEKTGYGAGTWDLEIPNLLRVMLGTIGGETPDTRDAETHDRVLLIETNLDNMNPEFYDHLFAKLFQAGALDVFVTPVQMKKNRPAAKLSVLSRPADKESMLAIIFAETTALGVRIIPVEREKLVRASKEVDTKYGKVRVKLAYYQDKVCNTVPEYEDCAALARQLGVPLKAVYDAAKASALNG